MPSCDSATDLLLFLLILNKLLLLLQDFQSLLVCRLARHLQLGLVELWGVSGVQWRDVANSPNSLEAILAS